MRVTIVLISGYLAAYTSGYLIERSGPAVVLTSAQQLRCAQPENQGYLPGIEFNDDRGGDCCSFVVCDSANLNKTGFLGKCMGGTVWNQIVISCDDPKQVKPKCEPTTCNIPVRTTEDCPSPLGGEQCCVGGRQPIYTRLSETRYRIDSISPNKFNECPPNEVFDIDSCCCERVYEDLPAPCNDLSSFYHTLPDEPGQPNDAMRTCCSFASCFLNRTGYALTPCMPPSVWNDRVKSCDNVFNVPECMGIFCGDETTDPPCPDENDLPPDTCCIAGQTYMYFSADLTMYMRTDGPGATFMTIQCCPEVDGVQLEFDRQQCICTDPVTDAIP
ncbi:unnamed protein product [Owenia fusiformis]|uniref:Uncharacterized protein n=1 Tax=Owenia fusiformis TaxID=6347 RepID=A0A8J1UBE2_OWEFU|nr:unnamed protein product [Owenia fusiformis]